eukprot:Polyplicarium_translucidae@DN2305_c0_g1_i1.p1
MHEMATSLVGADRQLKTAFTNLRLIAESFSLREGIVERCKEIVKDLQNGGNLRSRTGTMNMLAVVYLACREEGVTRTIKELVSFDRGISEKELGRSINRLKKLLPPRNQPLASAAAELIPRYCHRLSLSQQIVNVAEHACRKAEQFINRSHHPNSIAAGAIYFVALLCDAKPTPLAIANVAGVGEMTLRAIYKDLLSYAAALLPKDFKPSIQGGIAALPRT